LDDIEIERLVGGPPRVTLEEIVNHPRLPAARKLYLDRFLGIYGGDPFLVRLLMESGRFLLFHVAVVLEAAQDPDRPETWLTVSLLKRKMAMFGLASGRHIDALLTRLRAVGYLEAQRSDQDRRLIILKPTEAMRAHDREWLAAHYAPLTVLCPQHDYGLVMRGDRKFQAVHRRICMSFLPFGARLLQAVPDMLLFLNHAAGYPVIASLLQTAMADPDRPHAAVPYGDVGDRFGVSRTHVRKLLETAEEAGLVKLHERGGHRVEILPRLWASHDRAMAGGMYAHDLAYLAAMRTYVAETEAQSARRA
jgi:DNA-binding MarR family transcriptional regulator